MLWFSIPAEKSPGPDGYTSQFFKETWETTSSSIEEAIQHFFQSGKMTTQVNSTSIALIPKQENSDRMRQFRPISCCDTVYKCLSKVLANRLRAVLPSPVSKNQADFIQGRSISDNIVLAHELVSQYHSKKLSPRCALKLDLMKAFDSINLDFISKLLEVMKFPTTFIKWIKECIGNAWFSINVNGTLAGFFKGGKGIR